VKIIAEEIVLHVLMGTEYTGSRRSGQTGAVKSLFREQIVERVLADGGAAGDALCRELLFDVVAIETPGRS